VSNLEVRVEGLTARVSATDRILTHARAQLLEKDEALKAAERALKEAAIERSKFERRLGAAQDEISRLSTQMEDLQKSRAELADRSDMLLKALSAKEAAVDSANNKAASLADRIDHLTKRFEQERTALETANRRLIEDLQGEKAERSLAQGALEIARESRFKLQKQYAALKQKSRLAAAGDRAHEGSIRDGVVEDQDLHLEPESNVRRFPPTDDGQAPGAR
jgi:crescentin